MAAGFQAWHLCDGSVLFPDLWSSSAAQNRSSCGSVRGGSPRVRRLLGDYADAPVRNRAPCLMSGNTQQSSNSDWFFFQQSLCRPRTCNGFKRLPVGIFWNIKISSQTLAPEPVYPNAAVTHTLYLWVSDIWGASYFSIIGGGLLADKNKKKKRGENK